MSRRSITWVFFVGAILCLGVVFWRMSDSAGDKPPGQSGGPPRSTTGHLPGNSRISDRAHAPARPPAGGLLGSLPQPQTPPEGSDPEARHDWIQQRLDLIDDASFGDDEDALRLLIVEYGSPVPEIAEAAYDSLMARHDAKALPYLEEMLAMSPPARRQVQIEELIEFIKTPSLLDIKPGR